MEEDIKEKEEEKRRTAGKGLRRRGEIERIRGRNRRKQMYGRRKEK